MKDFREFLLRGNLVDMAVGIVIGLAFAAVISALVADLVTPLIAAIGGQPDFSAIKFTVHNSQFLIGDFLNAVIAFVILAAVIFFLVVKPMNALIERSQRSKATPAPTTRKCPYCLSEIPNAATRCAFCTQEVAAVS